MNDGDSGTLAATETATSAASGNTIDSDATGYGTAGFDPTGSDVIGSGAIGSVGTTVQNASANSAPTHQGTLLTRTQEEPPRKSAAEVLYPPKQEEAKTTGEKEAQITPAQGAPDVPESPEGYVLNFAEHLQVDEGLLGGFKATAHELGISQAQAQQLANFYAGHIEQSIQKAQQTQHSILSKQIKEWEGELGSRPGFAKEHADALRAIKEFGNPELTKTLDQSGLGSYPHFFDFMARIGKVLAEPSVRGGGISHVKRSAAEVLYGKP